MARNTLLPTLGLAVALSSALFGCNEGENAPMAIHNLEPRASSTAGEQAVQIRGTGFRNSVGYTVYFGSERAPAVTILDSTTLLVSTPAHDAGRVDVVIAADDGPAFRVVDAFEFADTAGNVYERMGESSSSGERF